MNFIMAPRRGRGFAAVDRGERDAVSEKMFGWPFIQKSMSGGTPLSHLHE